MAGLYLEQFSVGQIFVHEIRRTVTDMDNILFSALTYNPARVHIDHEYSKSTEFGKPLMNSIFTLGLIIGLTVQDTTLGTTVGNLGFEETKFPVQEMVSHVFPLKEIEHCIRVIGGEVPGTFPTKALINPALG